MRKIGHLRVKAVNLMLQLNRYNYGEPSSKI